MLAGRSVEWLEAACQEVPVSEAVRRGCRAAGVKVAEALLLAIGTLADEEFRAGAGRDPDADATAGALLAWLRAWKRGQYPRYQRRAGGGAP
eukprot:2106589-Alexandrium_andersonii.AAC.1